MPNAKAGRDQVDINVYGMEGVPGEVIEERLNMKMLKKRQKLEKELLKMGIDVDDPKFNIKDYEIPNPRPPKRRQLDMMMPPGGMMPGFYPPPMGMPPMGMMPPPGYMRMPPPGMMMGGMPPHMMMPGGPPSPMMPPPPGFSGPPVPP